MNSGVLYGIIDVPKKRREFIMPVGKDTARLTISMSKRNAATLEEISESLGISKASVINLALHDFIKKNFPEIKVCDSKYTIYNIPAEE